MFYCVILVSIYIVPSKNVNTKLKSCNLIVALALDNKSQQFKSFFIMKKPLFSKPKQRGKT